MKYFLFLSCILIFSPILRAQLAQTETTGQHSETVITDSALYATTLARYNKYEEVNRDSALSLAKLGLLLSQKNRKQLNEVIDLTHIAYQHMHLGNFAETFKNIQRAYLIATDPRSEQYYWRTDTFSTSRATRLSALAQVHHQFGNLMWRAENTEQEIFHYKEARRIGTEINDVPSIVKACITLGRAYANINQLDTALIFEQQAETIARKTGYYKYIPLTLYQKGIVYLKMSDTTNAVETWRNSIETGRGQNNLSALARSYHAMTNYWLELKNADSSLFYANECLHAITELKTLFLKDINLGIAYENLSRVFALRNQKDSIIKYQGIALTVNDSLTKRRIKSLADFQNLSFGEQMRLQQIEKEREAYQNKIRTGALITGILGFCLVALLLYRNNRQKTRSNIVLNKALFDLKSTQAQLIQSEKMASLGELTAGIAHEIQNPLNFVNNFSEVSDELIDELKTELQKGDIAEASALADHVKENLQKINHHGKRADSIVKGMLQHSRSSSGGKEPSDINALVDEYMRLAYNGYKAKDISFNAEIKTDFDPSIPQININPQDFGRVLLNLVNNAFYAVKEKQKEALLGYEPTVWLQTKRAGDKVEISVRDNGNGIPEKIKEKIFQPFFTTKPTGQGTGLGLSLSFDIITKGQGGRMKMESNEGTGSIFIIELPV